MKDHHFVFDKQQMEISRLTDRKISSWDMNLMLVSNMTLFVYCNVKDVHLSEKSSSFKDRQRIQEQQ